MRRSPFLSALMATLAVALALPALAAATAAPDLAVGISGTPDPVTAGSDITYTVTLQNIGGPGTNVELMLPLPAGTTFQSLAQSSGPFLPCATPAVGGTGTATCTSAALASAATATFSLVVRTDASLSAGTVLAATAIATVDFDGDPSNDSASTTTTTSTPPAPPAPPAPPTPLLTPGPVPTWGISPSHGPVTGGTAVTIQGIQFGGVTQVRFGDTPALFTVDSFNQITAIAPPHADATVPITMLRGVWSNPDEWMMFTYDPVAVAPQPVVPGEPAPGRSCVVPDLHRHTLDGARVLLARAGCSLGHVTRAKPRKGASRVRVARQSAPAGTRLAQGSAVAVVLRALR